MNLRQNGSHQSRAIRTPEADSGISSGCYYVRRNVLVPGIGIVSKRQMMCE